MTFGLVGSVISNMKHSFAKYALNILAAIHKFTDNLRIKKEKVLWECFLPFLILFAAHGQRVLQGY